MRYLLDTHAWLWLQTEPSKVPSRLLRRLENADDILLSAASTWEIAIKVASGKLTLPQPPDQYIPDRMARSGTTALPIEVAHTIAAAQLPPHHRDPFDRLLIAQAGLLSIPLVSIDRAFDTYDVDVRWS